MDHDDSNVPPTWKRRGRASPTGIPKSRGRQRHALLILGLALLVMLVAASVAAVLLSDGDKPSNETVALPKIPYAIKLKAAAEGSDRIVVDGRTNLPDGSIVVVSAGQAFRNRQSKEVREPLVAGYERATVTNGAFKATLGPLFYRLLTVGIPYPEDGFGPISELDNAVTVCASFRVGTDPDGAERQPDPAVRAAVGPNGEALRNSPQKIVFGSLTPNPSNALESVTRVRAGVENALEAVKALQREAPKLRRLGGFCT